MSQNSIDAENGPLCPARTASGWVLIASGPGDGLAATAARRLLYAFQGWTVSRLDRALAGHRERTCLVGLLTVRSPSSLTARRTLRILRAHPSRSFEVNRRAWRALSEGHS